jgi:hypothetical protein
LRGHCLNPTGSALVLIAALVQLLFFLFTLAFNDLKMDVKIEDSWKQVLKEEFENPYFGQIVNF